MTTYMKMFGEMMHLLQSGKKVALCTVIEKVGSGPRDVGAKIFVSEDGETFGTVGGENLEKFSVDESRARIVLRMTFILLGPTTVVGNLQFVTSSAKTLILHNEEKGARSCFR